MNSMAQIRKHFEMFQISILNASNQSIYPSKMLTRLYEIDKIQYIIFSLSRNYSTKLLLNISNQFMRHARLYEIDTIQHIIFSLSWNFSTKPLLNVSNQFMRQTC